MIWSNWSPITMDWKLIEKVSVWVLLLFLAMSAESQKYAPRIENIRMDFVGNHVEITYDITGSGLGHTHDIDFYVVDNIGNLVFPDSLNGDIGDGIAPGRYKKIIWEIYREFDVVYGDFEPHLILDGHESYGIKGGPGYAALSVIVPGLGDYFVADYRTMKIKPYYKTAFSYGFLALALAADLKREHIPPVMGEPGWYWHAYPVGDGHYAWVLMYKDVWVKEVGRTEYWLFRYDAEIFLGIGLTAMLVDVIWVARQGFKNSRLRNEFLEKISLNPTPGGLQLSFRCTF
jgi:hypothetical protein